MTLWRYEALAPTTSDRTTRGVRRVRRGEISADTAPEARAALRQAGLQVLSVSPIRSRVRHSKPEGVPPPNGDLVEAGSAARRRRTPTEAAARTRTPGDTMLARWLRARRVQARADALEAISMLLDSGVPLLAALETLTSRTSEDRFSSIDKTRRASASVPVGVGDSGAGAGAGVGGGGGSDIDGRLRRALVLVREDLRSGIALPIALARQPGWFDPVEVALVAAAESGKGLSGALRELADRHGASAKLSQKLVGSLTYPAIVVTVGIAVAMFLAVRTLPQLAGVLTASRVEVPLLTRAVMAVGRFAVTWGWLVALGVSAAVVLGYWLSTSKHAARTRSRFSVRFRGLVIPRPLVVRRIALSRASILIADLLRAGIPLVDALRLAAPACRGLAAGLGRALERAAETIEQGSDLVAALSRAEFRGWVDGEFLHHVSVGEASGDLAPVLERLGARYDRQAARLIDRLASVLEPATIIALAVFVGTVVMATILPLVKLQEILR